MRIFQFAQHDERDNDYNVIVCETVMNDEGTTAFIRRHTEVSVGNGTVLHKTTAIPVNKVIVLNIDNNEFDIYNLAGEVTTNLKITV